MGPAFESKAHFTQTFARVISVVFGTTKTRDFLHSHVVMKWIWETYAKFHQSTSLALDEGMDIGKGYERNDWTFLLDNESQARDKRQIAVIGISTVAPQMCIKSVLGQKIFASYLQNLGPFERNYLYRHVKLDSQGCCFGIASYLKDILLF